MEAALKKCGSVRNARGWEGAAQKKRTLIQPHQRKNGRGAALQQKHDAPQRQLAAHHPQHEHRLANAHNLPHGKPCRARLKIYHVAGGLQVHAQPAIGGEPVLRRVSALGKLKGAARRGPL